MLTYCVPDTVSGTAVSFVAPIDDAIDPIMDRIRALLMALALGGGVVGLVIVHAYTKRRVVSQVRRLAGHAEEIARGNLETVIEAQTPDELGYLASEFEKMRVQLAENRREIEAAHRERVDAERLAALGRFATGIIHDFKNPMAVVRGTADLIQSRFPENEKLSRQCTVIHRQVDRMVALTRDVLEYASGRSVLEVCEVDLESFLSEIRDGHLESFRRAGVKLLLRGEPITVTIDPVRLRRVIDNVITNALEVSKVGDSVTAEWGLVANGSVFVAIEDEGPGIPPGLADSIFDPFVTSGKEGGSGLGLAIARKIVQDHGADLRVGPGKNGGARFSIDLPSKLHVESKLVAAPEVR
jgi:signal transduction histidine kinase